MLRRGPAGKVGFYKGPTSIGIPKSAPQWRDTRMASRVDLLSERHSAGGAGEAVLSGFQPSCHHSLITITNAGHKGSFIETIPLNCKAYFQHSLNFSSFLSGFSEPFSHFLVFSSAVWLFVEVVNDNDQGEVKFHKRQKDPFGTWSRHGWLAGKPLQGLCHWLG